MRERERERERDWEETERVQAKERVQKREILKVRKNEITEMINNLFSQVALTKRRTTF